MESFRAAIVARQWTTLINCTEKDVRETWPGLEGSWSKQHVDAVKLSPFAAGQDMPSAADDRILGQRVSVIPDERRPGRRSLLVESGDVAVGVASSAQEADTPDGHQRVVILDASWTHVARFPEPEEVRQALEEALRVRSRTVFYITNLPWDAKLFQLVADQAGQSDRCRTVTVTGFGARMLWQVRELVPDIQSKDLVLLGLVPRRDDRGSHQRLRSDFAERTENLRVYPVFPLSSGPGASREEALQTVGLWLPTRVMIAAGPLSEQVLLARHLEENGGSSATVGTMGAEYRLPSLNLIRQMDARREQRTSVLQRLRGPRSGLVVVTYGRDEAVQLAGAGLPAEAEAILPRIRVSRRGKSAEQVVHDVETAFSSRGMPVPAVRFLP